MLGATLGGEGVDFALWSEHAERVELCLFEGEQETRRIELKERTGAVWHVYVPGVRPGQLYGYRVHGPEAPGHRFDPNCVLLDPYARLITQRSCVVDPAFDWGGDRPPRVPWQDTVIYELHVKGFTKRHPGVPEQLRGTYAGLASPAAVEHLKRLGITAVELLPIHAFVDEKRLLQHGLRNYWGYSSIGYFAPEMRYSASGTLGEFKAMVKTLHAAGIEVILDVVYNHTGEGDHEGPTLSFRGIDNRAYYRLDPADPRRYVDTTGTGNSLNAGHPAVLAMIMDSLRYWVSEMHVDGFRFDLTPTLVRDSSFLQSVAQDPVVSQVKLIAEPWDLGPDGYQLGRFPAPWREWNDKYRDAVRTYWRGDEGRLGELAALLKESRSIHFVTAHDGFTLHDLLTYTHKRNEANQEGNRDGTDDNKSWDAGAHREQQKRNLLATLFFSQGVPMLVAGDEMGRTQLGNNNAYCQDNEVSWLDWNLNEDSSSLLDFVRKLATLKFHAGDITWLMPQGGAMTEEEWKKPFARCVGMLAGERLVLFNAHDGKIDFALPPGAWEVLLDTAPPGEPGTTYPLQGRSVVLLAREGVK